MKKYRQLNNRRLKRVSYLDQDFESMSIADVEEVTEIISTPLTCSYNWDYSIPDTRIKRLYSLGKKFNWDVEIDLDWNESFDESMLASKEEGNPYSGFADYEQLDNDEKIRFSWLRAGLQASGALHGEQGALLVASQLASCAPSHEAKIYAASQTFDEARHVEFFNMFLRSKAKVMFPCAPGMKSLLDKILMDKRWDLKFVGMQVIIEGLALAVFKVNEKYSNVPVYKKGLRLILRDEARHVNFGLSYLEEYTKTLTQQELDERAVFAFQAATGIFGGPGRRGAIYKQYGWDPEKVAKHFQSEDGVEATRAKEFKRQLFGKILPNLNRIGLLTKKSEPMWDDFGVLEFKDYPPDSEISWDELGQPLNLDEDTLPLAF